MFKIGILFLITFCYLLSGALSRAADPDFRSIEADLKVPPLVEENIGPGLRTKIRCAQYQNEFYHILYLPMDWKPHKKFPVIVEYSGNGPYHDRNGDISTGLVEGSKLGYGLSGGVGYIWLCLPYLNSKGTENVRKWWGDAPNYDPIPTVEYCKRTVKVFVINLVVIKKESFCVVFLEVP